MHGLQTNSIKQTKHFLEGKTKRRITPRRNRTKYTYDSTTGQVDGITVPDGGSLSIDYDGVLLVGETWSGSVTGVVGTQHDANLLVDRHTVNGIVIDYAYDRDGLLTGANDLTVTRDFSRGLPTATNLGVVSTNYTYNDFGEISTFSTESDGTPVYSYSVDSVSAPRDKLGRIRQKIETIDGETYTYEYLYDSMGRLEGVRKDGLSVATYGYDTNGNRELVNGQTVAVYDDQDRLLNYGQAVYGYTANGEVANKTEAGDTTEYTHDVFGRLVQAKLPDGTDIEYIIDGQSRRIGKKINGTLVQGFLYKDQLNPIAELDGSGNIVALFVYGTRGNVPDYMLLPTGARYQLISDHVGSVRIVLDATTGDVVQRIEYDEFGRIVRYDSDPGFHQPFGFAGGISDADTGLVMFGVRDYDPDTGRWISKEPLLFGAGQTNFYAYSNNDPVNWHDPNGQNPILLGALAVGATCGLLELVDRYYDSKELERLMNRRDYLKNLEEQAWRRYPKFREDLQRQQTKRQLQNFGNLLRGYCGDSVFDKDNDAAQQPTNKDFMRFLSRLQKEQNRVKQQIEFRLAGISVDGKDIVCLPAGLL